MHWCKSRGWGGWGGIKTSENIPTPLHMWLNSRPAVACALWPPVGREASPSSSSSSSWSRLFKQSPAPACYRSQLRVHVWGDRGDADSLSILFLIRYLPAPSGRTRALVLRGVVGALLHSALQPFDLLVVVCPLGHDPHGRLQLGLLGHRVVTLRTEVGWKQGKRQQRLCCQQRVLTRSIVLALFLEWSSHQVSHQSQSWGRDLMGTWWIMLLGRSWNDRSVLIFH